MVNAATILVLLQLFFPLSALRWQQKEHRTPERGISSFIELYTKLERDIASAVQKHNTASLDRLLAPEFVLRSGEDPEHTVHRSEWLRNPAVQPPPAPFWLSSMAVRVFPGDVALVSFIAAAGKRKTGVLVIDVWIADRARKRWQLAQRYWAAGGHS